MGGKRRSSKQQGIRKKRKDATKQTLARVAERKEEQEDKLDRKLADAEARMRAARIGMLGGKPTEEQDVCDESEEAIQYVDNEEEDERSKIVNSKLENQQNAYERLVHGLQHSIFDGEVFDEQKHAARENERPLAKRLRSSEQQAPSDPHVGRLKSHKQNAAEEEISQETIEKENYAAAIREKAHFDSALKPFPPEGKLVGICTLPGVGKVSGLLSEDRRRDLETALETDLMSFDASRIGMPSSVYAKWVKSVEDIRAANKKEKRGLGSVHRAFITVLREYHDLFLSRQLHPADEDMIRRLYVAHCLSHVLRCRGRVIRNDAARKTTDEATGETKDQGFSRARVLLLLPFKNMAYEVVKMLQQLAVGAEEGEKNVSHVANSERFETEFAPDQKEDVLKSADNAANGGMPYPANAIRTPIRQSEEHQHVFRGNVDDDFKLGVAFSKKTMKLYTDFYASDIILASPLGLRRTIAEKASGQSRHPRKRKDDENEDTEWKTGLGGETEKPRFDDTDEDFLSSVEICVIDGAHVLSMQNWDTLLETMGMVNKMPVGTRDTDFSRVRDWCLDGLMPRFKQTLVLSSYRKSEFMTLFRELSNHAGKVYIAETSSGHGSMAAVTVRMRQTFFKVLDVTSPTEAPDRRLSFFFDEILPQIQALLDSQCLLVVPNYFDFVRIRNKLVKISEDDPSFRFASMCEYSKGSDITRVRSRLFDRSVALVVMTERFHFFWRHWIRGANTVVWYGLPENCHYYPEILNMTMEAAEVGRPVQAMALYDSFDVFPLERIVGRSRCKKMVAEDSRSTFLFV